MHETNESKPKEKEMNSQEMQEVNGGGEWQWGEAAIAFALLGLVGVGFYTCLLYTSPSPRDS